MGMKLFRLVEERRPFSKECLSVVLVADGSEEMNKRDEIEQGLVRG